MLAARLMALALVFTACPLFSQETVYQKLPLSRQQNGVDGSLEVIIDSRFTPTMIEGMWGNGDWRFALPDENADYKSFSANPPRKAELRVSDRTGKTFAQEALEEPLAKIAELQNSSTFLVTVDYSIGWGSYAGPTSFLLSVEDGNLRWLQARDEATGKSERISLAKTLKSDWKLSSQASGDVLAFFCRPVDFANDNGFELHYVRYHFDNVKGWLKHERVKKGMWESDQPFPPRSDFP